MKYAPVRGCHDNGHSLIQHGLVPTLQDVESRQVSNHIVVKWCTANRCYRSVHQNTVWVCIEHTVHYGTTCAAKYSGTQHKHQNMIVHSPVYGCLLMTGSMSAWGVYGSSQEDTTPAQTAPQTPPPHSVPAGQQSPGTMSYTGTLYSHAHNAVDKLAITGVTSQLSMHPHL